MRGTHELFGVDDIDVVIPAWGPYVGRVADAAGSADGARVTVVTDPASRSELAGLDCRVVLRSGRSIGSAREDGRRATAGRLLIFLDADDQLAPGAVETLLELLNRCPSAVASCGRFRRLRGGGSWPSALGLRLVTMPGGSALLLLKNLLPTTGACLMVRAHLPPVLFPDEEDEDWHAAVRLRSAGRVLATTQTLLRYDDAPGTVSRRPRDAGALERSHRSLLPSGAGPVLQLLDRAAQHYRRRQRERLLARWNRRRDGAR